MGREKIAIIGSYGCGKTVLLTVLTHRYQKSSKEGYQILPDNQDANAFCLKNWNYLQNGEWPPPTQKTDNPPTFCWKLRFGKKEKDMITSDIAGEAWRDFIINNAEEIENNSSLSSWETMKKKWESIPATLSQVAIKNHLMTVEKLLNEASSILFLLDLSQIIDKEVGYEEATWLPITLEKYLKEIGKQDVPITLVLSKADKYKYLYNKKHDWRAVLEDYIPRLPQCKSIIPVAAVAKTKGKAPAQDFPSEGLEELFESIWGAMSGNASRSIKRGAKRFVTFDIPLLVGFWLITFFLVSINPTLAGLFFILALSSYLLVKVFLFLNK